MPASSTSSSLGTSLIIPESAARTRRIRIVALLMIGVSLAYLIWRALFTLDLVGWWISIPFLLLEIHVVVSLILQTRSLWNVAPPPRPRMVTATAGRIAVLIPTYDESDEVLLPVIAGAVALQPNHETWVLDDGDRPWLRQLATELGARYLARPEHTHARAGNLNHALGVIRADFIAVLDADHVPGPNFLINTLGYFDDPRVALVQTPQEYYNLDSCEHATGNQEGQGASPWYEQGLFFRMIQAGKYHHDAAFWCGTSAVVRVAALNEIGGVATETITEDMHTSLRLQQRGWKIVYHNEVLARGLATRTAEEYQQQRYRWGAGTMQILRTDNPLTAPGLRLSQRIEYMTSILYWFDSWRTLGLLLVPIIVLLTGVFPIRENLELFVAAWSVTTLVQEIGSHMLSRGYRRTIPWIVFRLIDMVPHLLATLTLVRRKPLPFRVTPKGGHGNLPRRGRAPHLLIALAILSAVALLWSALTIAGITPLHYANLGAAIVNILWATINLLLVLAAIVRSIRHGAERRGSFHFVTDLRGDINGRRCRIRDVSMTGALVSVTDMPANRQIEAAEVGILTLVIGDTIVRLGVAVRSRRTDTAYQVTYGLQFLGGQAQERARLAVALFNARAPLAHKEPWQRTIRLPELAGTDWLPASDPGASLTGAAMAPAAVSLDD